MSTHADYTARILSYVQGKDPIAVQRQTPELIAQLIEGKPNQALVTRPGADKWSVAELLAHLADSEIGASWRYRQMIEHSGGNLPAYDQELWNVLGKNSSRNPAQSLQLFRLLRAGNVGMFERLSDEQWQNYGVHAERGKMSVRDLMQQVAGHDLNHADQIRSILTK
jgi:hypothetical protein